MATSLILALSAAAALVLAAAPPNLDEALRAQQALADSSPGDVRILNDLANLLSLAGRLEEAEEVYRRALDLDPEQAATHYNLALVLQQTGRAKAATVSLRSALDLDPDHAWAHYQLGTLLAAADKRARAVDHFAQAFSLDERLTLPEYNSHLIENPLATEALLLSRSRDSSAGQAPRQYAEPARVADLLAPLPESIPEPSPLPEMEGEMEEEMDEPEEEEPAYRGSRVISWEAEEDEEDEPAFGDEADLEEELLGVDEEEADEMEARERRRRQTRPGRVVGSGAGQPSTGEPTEGTTRPRPRTRILRPEDLPSTPPSGGTGRERPRRRFVPEDRFEPDLRSTGRLDLQLLPEDETRLALVASGSGG